MPPARSAYKDAVLQRLDHDPKADIGLGTGRRGFLVAGLLIVFWPIVIGFGISRPAHLAALEGHADGAIVASALLDAIGEAPDDAANQVRRFLRGLRTPA